jgi:hypothetical protein
MAIDVYLIVFRCYDTESLRKLEWKYIIGISTLTFIPAMVLLLIDTPEKGPMYGSVTVRGISGDDDHTADSSRSGAPLPPSGCCSES